MHKLTLEELHNYVIWKLVLAKQIQEMSCLDQILDIY